MSVREYIGARYMPVFADPIEWDISLSYEPLTVVKNQGTSYVSRRSIPEGIQITNEDYWVRWADYNAQLEEYIRRVNLFDQRITDNEDAIEDINGELAIIDANSWVTETRIANNAVTSSKIADGAVNTSDIADNAITTSKLAEGMLDYIIREGDNVVVYSDSTFQRNPDLATGIYAKAVYEFLHDLSGATIDNRGVGGTAYSHLLETLNNTPPSSLENADFILVAYGTNDWQASRETIKLSNAQSNTLEELVDSCIKKLNTLAPRATVIVFTPGYVHSTAASPNNALNVNNGCGSIYNYCEVIEHVCRENNTACVRLDKILGITEENYISKMIPSNNNIWVHYSEKTNELIAKGILSGLYLLNGFDDNNYANMTPQNWKESYNRIGYYGYNYVMGFYIPESGSVSFETPTINTNDYYISFCGANYNVYQNNVLIGSSSTKTAPVSYKLNKYTQGNSTIRFERYNDSVNVPLVGLQLTKGKPSVYEALCTDWPLIYRHNTTIGVFKLALTETDMAVFADIGISGNFTPASGQAIFTWPSDIRPKTETAVGSAIFISGGSFHIDTIRITPSGGVYLNDNWTNQITGFNASIVIPK